jgi:hypothetical protein
MNLTGCMRAMVREDIVIDELPAFIIVFISITLEHSIDYSMHFFVDINEFL